MKPKLRAGRKPHLSLSSGKIYDSQKRPIDTVTFRDYLQNLMPHFQCWLKTFLGSIIALVEYVGEVIHADDRVKV